MRRWEEKGMVRYKFRKRDGAEHNDIRQIMPSEIQNCAFCPPDEEILKKIIVERGLNIL